MQKIMEMAPKLRAHLNIAAIGKHLLLLILVILTIAASAAFRPVPQAIAVAIPLAAAETGVARNSTLNADVFQKFVSKTSQHMYPRLCREIVEAAIRYSEKYDLSPILVLAIADAESQFHPFALSKQNAKGLMQINTQANQQLLMQEGIFKEPADAFDPERNIEAGCFLLRRFINECSDFNSALDRYLGAESTAYKAEIHQVMGRILLLGVTEELNKTAAHKIEPIIKVEAAEAK